MANNTQTVAKFDTESVADIFKCFSSIEAVYLFGSHAEGRARADSDIDLAVVPRRDADAPDKPDLLTELARAGFDNVDLLILDAAQIASDYVLAYETVRLNRVINQTDDFARRTLYSGVVRQYLGFKPYLDVQREANKRRMLSGQS